MSSDKPHETSPANHDKKVVTPSVAPPRNGTQAYRVLKARVDQVKASGVVVHLSTNERAWLPAQELLPNHKPHEDLRDKKAELHGKEFEVVEFDSSLGHRDKIVSHIRVGNDPWRQVDLWEEGAIKVMEVTVTTSSTAIGIIPPGVRAEVRLSVLCNGLPTAWSFFSRPLVGDLVAGLFHRDHVDYARRSVELDVVSYVHSQIGIEDALAPSLAAQRANTSASLTAQSQAGVEPREFQLDAPLHEIHDVLFVDDDDLFRASVSAFLTDRGCDVFECSAEAQAMAAVEQEVAEFQLAIIDLHLRGTTDCGGLLVASHLQSIQPNCSIVLITGADLDPDHPMIWGSDLRIVDLVLKPFGYQELHRVLAAVHRRPQRLRDLVVGSPADGTELSATSNSLDGMNELNHTAEELRRSIGAEGVVLFSLHPVTFAVEIVAKADPQNMVPFVKPRIERSPVQDVSRRGETVFTDNAEIGRDFLKHRYLQQAYGYRSCIGVPVVLGVATSLCYGLFAFHSNRRAFLDVHRLAVARCAREMAYLLRITQLRTELEQVKRFEMMGKVYGSMAHDLSQSLSSDFLMTQLESFVLSKGADPPGIDPTKTIAELRKRNDKAITIVRTFRNMVRGTREDLGEVNVHEHLCHLIDRFRSEAEEYGTSADIAPHEGPPCVIHMRSNAFEQLIYNLLLNAAQQIDCIKEVRTGHGRIVAETRCREDTDGFWVDILIHDNGPGIHQRDFKRVFDIHYTTKPRGCGMGLSICRGIARDITATGRCGAIAVERSVLLVGTTFKVSLPLPKRPE